MAILDVSKYFEEIASVTGEGSKRKKERLIQGLLHQATPREAKYILRILLGEMRIGAVEGVVLEAISESSSIDLDLVRRSNMLRANLGEVARIALKQGREGLEKVGIARALHAY